MHFCGGDKIPLRTCFIKKTYFIFHKEPRAIIFHLQHLFCGFQWAKGLSIRLLETLYMLQLIFYLGVLFIFLLFFGSRFSQRSTLRSLLLLIFMNNLQECDFSSPHKSSLWYLPYSLPWWETSVIVRRENDHIQRNYDESHRIEPDLQGDYCNRRHLDKADQSDYKKITIHSRKVGGGPISSSWKIFSRYHLHFHGGRTLISSIRVFWLFSTDLYFTFWRF